MLFDLPGPLSQQLYRHLRGRWPAWFTSQEGARVLAVSLDPFDVDLEMLLETVATWAGEAGLRTVLVTTGSTRPADIEKFPYRPTRIVDSIADLVELVRPAEPAEPAEG